MNQTIYFRKSVWDKLSEVDKKSELINELLEKHFKMSSNTTQRNTTRRNTITKNSASVDEPTNTPPTIKTKEDKVFPQGEAINYTKTSNWGA